MKLINYGDTDWLIGDDAATLLLEYSVLMAKGGSADSVDVAVLKTDGSPESVSFLIGPATMMTSRAFDTAFDEPDNELAVARMERAMRDLVPTPISRMTSSEIESLARTFEGSDDADG